MLAGTVRALVYEVNKTVKTAFVKFKIFKEYIDIRSYNFSITAF